MNYYKRNNKSMVEDKGHMDLIEGFLQNTLNEDELETFEDLLITDEKFGELFIDMKTIADGIRSAASKTTLEEKLERLEALGISEGGEQDIQPEDEKKGFIIIMFDNLQRHRWAVAAIFTFFVVAAVLLTRVNTTPTGDELFDAYFSPFSSGGTYALMRGDSVKDDIRGQAFYYYDMNDFMLANEYFHRILDQNANNISALFYSGNAHLAMDQINEAIDCFKKVISLGNGLEIQAKWYLALCYLKLEKYPEMVPLLKEIIESNTRYSGRAKELLLKIT